ncbi:organic cation transporter protein [Galendromus occidentalis]|uniref:Organic cation transporter protein n=1 Tax=Galendromus occidentalis TaxID=34638 RepID=A0AAJ7L689_9ACAR|nr:organic cation transporter protein [Galendromus occidentalis]
MDADVVEVIGRFGIYHGLLLALACIRAFPAAWTNMMSPLMAADVAHWCAAPDGSLNETWWKENGIPRGPSGDLEECSMFRWTLDGGIERNSTSECTNGWVYDKSKFGETVTSEWNLVCGDAWKRSLMQSIIMAGAFAGVLTFGKLSDTFGRKRAFHLGLLLLIISGIAATFSGSFMIFNALRFIQATCATGVTTALVTMFIEIMPGKDRIYMNVGFGMGYAVPVLFIPVLSYYLLNFRYMQLAIGLSGFLLVPFVPFVYESPKWLLAKQRVNSAETVITRIIDMNKRPMPNMDSVMVRLARLAESESAQRSKDLGFVDFLRVPILRRTATLLAVMWCTNSLRSYYLALNAHRLPGNPHVNFAISTFSEFPAGIVGMYLLRKCPRRVTQAASTILAGALFAMVFLARDSSELLKVWGSMVVRVFMTLFNYIQWVQVHEVYPTAARGAGFALAMMASRVGAGLAPFLKDLGDLTDRNVPLILFLVCSTLDLCLVYLLPETLNKRLPDTIEDAENLLKQTRDPRVRVPTEDHNEMLATGDVKKIDG